MAEGFPERAAASVARAWWRSAVARSLTANALRALRVPWGSASASPDRFGHGGRSQQASHLDGPIAGGLCRRRRQPLSGRNGANHRVDGLRPKCSCPPEGDERDGQADGALGIRLETPVQRRAQLIRLAVEPAKPEHHLGTHQWTLGLKGEVEAIAKVRCSKAFRVAHVHEPIARVLPDRLQHVVPRLFRGLRDDERFPLEPRSPKRGAPRIESSIPHGLATVATP